MRKLFYIANIRFPTERAHGIQIMEMCQAFAGSGLEVELVVPDRHTEIKEDPFAYYDIKGRFSIRKLSCLDWVGMGKVGFWIESATFALSMISYSLRQGGTFYARDEMMALLLSLVGKKVIWESHMGHRNIWIRGLIRRRVPIVVISEGLKELCVRMGAAGERLLVAPDGADIDRFDLPISSHEARAELGLPQDKKIILYKGSLIPWKGAGTLAESAQFINTSDVLFVFIGGTPEDVGAFRKDYGSDVRIDIKGNRPRKETPIYQKAADILVIPNSAKEDISKLYTSPMKLFGYMAGGVPIVASDLPSLREILGESDAYFFNPDDAHSLAKALDDVFADYGAAKQKATRSLEKVRQYSWKRRARAISDFSERV